MTYYVTHKSANVFLYARIYANISFINKSLGAYNLHTSNIFHRQNSWQVHSKYV